MRAVARMLAAAVPSLAVATIAVGFLQNVAGVANASAIYLVAVVVTAFVAGTWGGIVAAVASFLLYDFLFVLPLYTLTVADSGEWLNLVLLLFIGIVVGQLVALLRSRAEVAEAREREARDLFQISRALATRASTPAVLPIVADILRRETAMDRVWVALGADDAAERVAADTEPGDEARRPGPAPRPPANAGRHARPLESRPPAGREARHAAGPSRGVPRPDRGGGADLRLDLGVSGERDGGEPDRTATRLLSAAADQVGQALAQDRLAAEAQAAEIARQSDALKSALLQSVSHDLRTPLATIRAAAGTLRPGSGLSESDQRESADAIDREVEYLNRLVTNLLDLSRIEAGALRAERDVYELDDLVGRTIERMRGRLGDRPLSVELAGPPVTVDPVFLDEAVTNALENAIKYAPEDAPIRVVARPAPAEGRVRLTIEDGGPGVPDATLPLLFDKFYRVPGTPGGSRSGTGIGLAVVRGLVEAMGGRVEARPSELGGLAIDIDLPAAAALAPAPAVPCVTTTRPPAIGPTILVVEDDEETRAALRRELAVRGYRTVEAADGRGALRALGEPTPGPGPAGPGASRHGRTRHRATRPPGGDHADRDPLRPVRGAGEGRGPGARRRRLRHQAVRRGRAQRSSARRPPARGRTRGRRRPARSRPDRSCSTPRSTRRA